MATGIGALCKDAQATAMRLQFFHIKTGEPVRRKYLRNGAQGQ